MAPSLAHGWLTAVEASIANVRTRRFEASSLSDSSSGPGHEIMHINTQIYSSPLWNPVHPGDLCDFVVSERRRKARSVSLFQVTFLSAENRVEQLTSPKFELKG